MHIMNGLLLCVGPRLCDTFSGDDKGSFMVHVQYEGWNFANVGGLQKVVSESTSVYDIALQ